LPALHGPGRHRGLPHPESHSHEARHPPRLSRPHRGHDRRHHLQDAHAGGKPDATLRLDIDPKSHPAWTGVQRIMDTGGQVAKFNKKFAGIGLKKG
jgi:ribosomal protein L31